MRLIDADKLKEEIKKWLKPYNPNELEHFVQADEACVDFITTVDEQPTVERPKGEWIRDTITNLFHCSNCRMIEKLEPNKKPCYCPNCGAEMEIAKNATTTEEVENEIE